MSGLTRFEVGFWLVAFVCALAALAWLASSLDALADRRAKRRAARKPVPYQLAPAAEAITWEPGGTSPASGLSASAPAAQPKAAKASPASTSPTAPNQRARHMTSGSPHSSSRKSSKN